VQPQILANGDAPVWVPDRNIGVRPDHDRASLADIETSPIAAAIIESCPTRIFLPNERAIEPQILATYRRFGLNDRQIEIIARATPKRDYYCQSRRGNRLFELGLGDVALAYPARSLRAKSSIVSLGLPKSRHVSSARNVSLVFSK